MNGNDPTQNFSFFGAHPERQQRYVRSVLDILLFLTRLTEMKHLNRLATDGAYRCAVWRWLGGRVFICLRPWQQSSVRSDGRRHGR